MSTVKVLQINSTSSETSEKIGEKLGSHLKGGEVVELISDLGGGKTIFTRGIAKGAGSLDHVSSPTFTISNIYKTKDLRIWHFDFYRLHEAGLVEHELQEALDDKKAVIIVEWSDVVKHVLPSERITIHIISSGDESRRFEIHYPQSLSYIVEDL